MSVIWHDLECGSYGEDLALWRSLVAEHGDPVLDIGAGTGRVALDLARRGHRVTALDHDRTLLDELAVRGRGVEIETVVADARSFAVVRRFALCLVPMQTIQLLGGRDGRLAFLQCARRHLAPAGVLAMAIADALETYEIFPGGPAPLPDIRELNGVVYASQPVAIRRDGQGFVLQRRRETVMPTGARTVQDNRIRLDPLEPEQLEREGAAVGLRALARSEIPATEEYVGSVVVMLRG